LHQLPFALPKYPRDKPEKAGLHGFLLFDDGWRAAMGWRDAERPDALRHEAIGSGA
jgi:hypothetical protein